MYRQMYRTEQTVFKKETEMTNNYLNTCSISLAMRKILIKTTLRYHLIPVRKAAINKSKTNTREDVERWDPLFTTGGDEN